LESVILGVNPDNELFKPRISPELLGCFP